MMKRLIKKQKIKDTMRKKTAENPNQTFEDGIKGEINSENLLDWVENVACFDGIKDAIKTHFSLKGITKASEEEKMKIINDENYTFERIGKFCEFYFAIKPSRTYPRPSYLSASNINVLKSLGIDTKPFVDREDISSIEICEAIENKLKLSSDGLSDDSMVDSVVYRDNIQRQLSSGEVAVMVLVYIYIKPTKEIKEELLIGKQ